MSLLTNIAAMSALTTLKSINTQLDATSNRVSTGQRVSSAADNAAYWSIATTVRTDNASLSAVKDSLGLGSSAVDTTYNGLNSIITDLQNMRAKLQTALQPGVDRAKVQTEISAIQSKMKATADSSVSSGQNWLSVDSSSTNTAYRATQRIVSGFSRDPSGSLRTSSVDIDVAGIALYDVSAQNTKMSASAARVTGDRALPGTINFGAGTSARFTLSVDGGAGHDIVLDRTTLASAVPDLSAVSPAALVSAINNAIASDAALAGGVRASLDGAGRLTFETTATGGARSLMVGYAGTAPTGNRVANGGFENGLAGWSMAGSNILQSPNAHTGASSLAMGSVGSSGTMTTSVPTEPGQSYNLEFWLGHATGLPNHFAVLWDGAVLFSADNAASTQPYALHQYTVMAAGPVGTLTFEARHDPSYWYVDDVSVTAIGGTGPSLGFGDGNWPQRVGFGSEAVAVAKRGLLDTVDGGTGTSTATIDIADLRGPTGDTALSALITQLDRTMAQVVGAGTKLGANKTQIEGQIRFVDTLMKVNDRTIGILVDADVEEESTRLKALQTQQQLAIQALGIANGSNAVVLTLFR